MIEAISTIIGTGVVVSTAIGAILKGFYKTNREATEDSNRLEKDFEEKLEKLETKLRHEIETEYLDVKTEFKNIADKIDDMKSCYVSNENFKTYATSISQLLQMSTDRMTRIEATLDDIRDDINVVIRSDKKI
jgi:negative regulator of genetic competence, sporulation and motility